MAASTLPAMSSTLPRPVLMSAASLLRSSMYFSFRWLSSKEMQQSREGVNKRPRADNEVRYGVQDAAEQWVTSFQWLGGGGTTNGAGVGSGSLSTWSTTDCGAPRARASSPSLRSRSWRPCAAAWLSAPMAPPDWDCRLWRQLPSGVVQSRIRLVPI